jgi:hypothetical protein
MDKCKKVIFYIVSSIQEVLSKMLASLLGRQHALEDGLLIKLGDKRHAYTMVEVAVTNHYKAHIASISTITEASFCDYISRHDHRRRNTCKWMLIFEGSEADLQNTNYKRFQL